MSGRSLFLIPSTPPHSPLQVINDKLVVTFQDNAYRAYLAKSEDVSFTLTYDASEIAGCEGTSGNSGRNRAGEEWQMACGCGVCSTTISVDSEPNELQTPPLQNAASYSILAASLAAAAVSPATAGALGKLSIITTMCPEKGVKNLDQTINPLGLSLGEGNNAFINGALVASIIIQTSLLLISFAISYYMYRKLDYKRMKHRGFNTVLPTEEEMVLEAEYSKKGTRVIHTGLNKEDVTYLAARGRFGWILIPATFLFAGAALCSVSALMYSTPFYKFIAACDIVVFICGLLAYATMVARDTKKHSIVENFDDPTRPWYYKMLWGWAEWRTNRGRGHGAWVELNHLLYDGYIHSCRYFLTYELLITFGIGAVGAWSPQTFEACWIKSSLTIALLVVFLLSLLLLRPYLAPYENVLETAIAAAEVAIASLLLVAMGQDNPNGHWSAGVAYQVTFATVWLVTGKAMMDMTVFLIDEHGLWKETQAELEPKKRRIFVAHLLCCGNNIPGEGMNDYVVRYEDSTENVSNKSDDASVYSLYNDERDGESPEEVLGLTTTELPRPPRRRHSRQMSCSSFTQELDEKKLPLSPENGSNLSMYAAPLPPARAGTLGSSDLEKTLEKTLNDSAKKLNHQQSAFGRGRMGGGRRMSQFSAASSHGGSNQHKVPLGVTTSSGYDMSDIRSGTAAPSPPSRQRRFSTASVEMLDLGSDEHMAV